VRLLVPDEGEIGLPSAEESDQAVTPLTVTVIVEVWPCEIVDGLALTAADTCCTLMSANVSLPVPHAFVA
jgi:hypothetical protein